MRGSFFLTGNFYRNKKFQPAIKKLNRKGHYFGAHSDGHLLYCDWSKRDSLLVTKEVFQQDLHQNLERLKSLGLPVHSSHFFIPPYEWWNDSISIWSEEMGQKIVSFTPGIRTNADYTYPEMGTAYKTSDWIIQSLKEMHQNSPAGLNGGIVLIHVGVDKRRPDKLYNRLDELIKYFRSEGYQLLRIDEMLN